jgi:uncharacterized protein YbbC (DUF1343 family)
MQHPLDCWHIGITGTFGELHTINEGVGYPAPFEYTGAPFIDSNRLAKELNVRHLPGLYFRPVYYKPFYGTYKDQMCGGVQTMITDLPKVKPVQAGVHILEAVAKLYPNQDVLRMNGDSKLDKERRSMFDKVMGTDSVRKELAAGKTADEIIKSWEPARAKFEKERTKYFLYK